MKRYDLDARLRIRIERVDGEWVRHEDAAAEIDHWKRRYEMTDASYMASCSACQKLTVERDELAAALSSFVNGASDPDEYERFCEAARAALKKAGVE